MKILRVLNNNVVLAKDPNGEEVIITGRGVGFNKRAGMFVEEANIVRVFEPKDGRDPDHLAQMLAEIDQEVIRAVVLAIDEIQIEDSSSKSPTLVIAIADHISGALKRLKNGQAAVVYPLQAEVTHLYASEYQQAKALLKAINRNIDPKLEPSESIALTLHIVNSGFSTGNLAFTYTMTGLIQQMLQVIAERHQIEIDDESVSVARFITHVRYLFVRIAKHQQLNEGSSIISDGIASAYPRAMQTARQLAALIQLRLGVELSFDEKAYLALHIARITEINA